MPRIPALPNFAGTVEADDELPLYDTSADTTYGVTVADLATAVATASGAIDDAPVDGTIYARLDGAWVEVPQRADINTISASTQAPTTAIYATPTAGVLGRFFRCTSASGCAVTLPSFATSPFQAGTMLTYMQEDASAPVTFTAGSGATLVVPASYQASTAEQYAVVQVVKVSTNTWLLYGHLLPV